MAIDTAEKRRCVAGIPLGTGVTPNAVKDQEWRQEVGWGYCGILAAAAVVAAGIVDLTAVARDFSLTAVIRDFSLTAVRRDFSLTAGER